MLAFYCIKQAKNYQQKTLGLFLSNATTLSLTEYPGIVTSDLSKSSTIFWALVCSIFLHGFLAYYLPNISFDEVKKSEPLKIELVKKEAPPPAPEPMPEPPPPEPVKPKLPEPKPIKQPKPLPIKEVPMKTPEPIAQPASPPPPPQTEVIAVTPKPEAPPSPVPPAPVVAPPPPPPPPGPSEADLDDARNQYGHSLWSAIEKHKQYPRIAQMRGWQGEVIVELLLDGSGKLKSKKILSSSGHDVLDRQALDMVEKAAPFPLPPEVLRGNQFSIKVPVPFKLQD